MHRSVRNMNVVENSSPFARSVQVLRQWIEQGVLRPGARIPVERSLAEKIGVSRPTIHSALEELAAEGYVKPYRKRGWMVAEETNASRLPLSHTVGVIGLHLNLAQLVNRRTRSHPLYVYAGLLGSLQQEELHSMTLDPSRLKRDGVDALIDDGLRGVVVLREAAEDPELRPVLERLQERKVPTVVHADGLDANGLDSVSADHVAGSYRLTEWLIEHNRTRILRVWDTMPDQPRPGWLKLRDEGYEDACAAHGVKPLTAYWAVMPSPFMGADSEEQFRLKAHLMHSYLQPFCEGENAIDAIMLPSDRQVFCVAAALRMLGLEPNRDVWVAGYDNGWADCRECEWEPAAPAATVDKRNNETGRALFRVLQQRLNHPARTEPLQRLVLPELIDLTSGRERNEP